MSYKCHTRVVVLDTMFQNNDVIPHSALEMMPDVARKILSKDSTADIERTKENTEAEMTASGGISKHQGFEVNGMYTSYVNGNATPLGRKLG